MRTDPQFSADLFRFTKEVHSGKLHFVYSNFPFLRLKMNISLYITLLCKTSLVKSHFGMRVLL